MIRAAVLDTTLSLPEGGGSELLPLFVGGTRRARSTSGAGPGLTVIRFGRISRLTGETGTKTPSPSEAPAGRSAITWHVEPGNQTAEVSPCRIWPTLSYSGRGRSAHRTSPGREEAEPLLPKLVSTSSGCGGGRPTRTGASRLPRLTSTASRATAAETSIHDDDRRRASGGVRAPALVRGGRPRQRQVSRRTARLPRVLTGRGDHGIRVPQGGARRARGIRARQVPHAAPIGAPVQLGAGTPRCSRPRGDA